MVRNLCHRSGFGLSLASTLSILLLLPTSAAAATWTYDFGTTTGTWNTGTSSSFLPSPPSGTSFVRVGTGGGSVALENPGSTSLGAGSELVLTAPTATSVNKFSVFDYTGSNYYSLSFSTIISGNSGVFTFFTGNGASFSNANTFTGTESAASLRFGLGASTISGSYRNVSTWTALSSLSVSKDSVMDFAIYGNNDASSTTYFRGGTTYSLPAGTWDLWLGNTLSGTNLNKAQLTTGVVDSFMVYGESSTGNAGTLRLDKIVYGNELPVAPPSGNYWAPAAGGGGSGTWSPTGVAWATASGTIGSGTQAASAALVFGDNAGTVTVSGSVAVPAGLTISTDGYQFTSGTIALTGTSTAANTITTGSGITATVSSLLVGSNGFTKAGLGTLLLGGSNSNSGAVTVSAGTLKVNGVLGSGSLSVAAAAWLMGTGTINGPVTVSGTLAPGSSPGVLALGSLMLTDTSTAVIEIASAGTRGTAYDGISILDAGGLTYGGTMALAFGGSAIANDTTFDVFSFTGSSAGSLAAIESTGFYAGTWTSLGSGTFRLVSGSQTLTFSQSSGDIIVVPEPAAIALVGLTLGAGSLALLRRRRRA
jgi:autotransporter-associated beta strand protein